MNLRLLLLAGAVFPLTLNYPAVALDRAASSSGGIVLAQAEEPCPEGQECPPPEEQPAPEEAAPTEPAPEQPAPEQPAPEQPAPEQPAPEQPAPEQPAPEQPAPEQPAPEQAPADEPAVEQPAPEQPAPEQPAAEQPAPEQPAPEQPAAEQPAPEQPAPEQPAPEQPAPEQPAAEQPAPEQPAPEQPAAEQPATEAPTQENAVERARRRQQELQQQGGQQPAPADQPAEAAQTPPAEPPPVEEQSTVEQQLEAQGDTEQAEQVRTLRDRLRDQMQEVLGAQPQDQQTDDQGNRRDRRRGDRDRDGNRDRDRDWGWDRHDDEDVVEERGGRIIIDLGGGNIYVRPDVPDEGGRLLYGADDVEVQNLPGGRTRTIVYRDNGVQIVTVRDRYGDIVRRTKVLPNGREIVLIDNRFPDDYEGGPPPILYDLPPLIVRIPDNEYIVDYGNASNADIRGALLAPPVQEMERPYTLDEVLHNEQVRAYSPRIDLDSITFEFGSSTIGNDQMAALSELGQAMEEVIAEHPDEVYLIEGHTDKVGSDYDNLILSDERAEAVATALSQNFDIPPENLVTEGYGEQYPKVDTEGPERRNRRATLRRLTDLLQAENQ